MTCRRDGHGVLKLDKATAWMLQRRLHRNDHAGFQRPLRIIGVVRDRTGIGQARRFVTDEPHAVGEKLVVVVRLRFSDDRFGCRINLCAVDAGFDWSQTQPVA